MYVPDRSARVSARFFAFDDWESRDFIVSFSIVDTMFMGACNMLKYEQLLCFNRPSHGDAGQPL